MKDDKNLIARGIAQSAQVAPPKEFAQAGLVTFLREQIVDAEWKIVRAKAEIDAYETAIKVMEGRNEANRSHLP